MLIDSHCHIDFSDFDEDRSIVIERAIAANIHHIIVPAISAQSWDRVKQTCLEYPQLHGAYGLHPYFLDQHKPDHIDNLLKFLVHANAVAVGECGLDYYLKHLDKTRQLYFFEAQLAIASELKLPVIIHSRKATEQVIQSIKKYPGLLGMIHSYSGSFEQATKLIDLGFLISFGGAITYDRATRLRELVTKIPLDALLIETDAPDQPDQAHHKQRNEPVYILEVLKTLAHLKSLPADIIADATSKNAIRLFDL